ncbi:MAG: phospholipid carrier-dependent glycosyltransferase [Microgenomates group bacterium]
MKKAGMIIALICITLGALFLRVNKISSIPPALSWDEVSIGYNAYSILKTGKDEHGKFLPIDTFVAYGDYKPPLAIYLTVPSIAAFGLTDFAVRFPSALFGSLTVLATFFLVIKLFGMSKLGKETIQWVALLSSTVLAVSPWHINLSRAGFEANIALFFVVLGVYLILVAVGKPKMWIVAWLPFVAAVYTFNSARYFAPLFGLVLCVVFWKSIKVSWKQFLIGAVIACIAMVPILPHLVSSEARLRFEEVNIFTDASVVVASNERMAYDNNSIVGRVLHNRRIGFALSYLRHFADNLQPSFLFVTGDGNPKFSTQVVGQMYMMEAPLLAVGLIALFVTAPQIAWILLIWIILAIVPAATARETPHALRILNSLPVWQIIVAYGITVVFGWVAKYKKIASIGIGIVFVGVYIFSIGYYLHNYYAHYAGVYSGEWQYGYAEAITAAQKIEVNYDKMYVSSTIGRPYMYTLFYTKFDPNEYLKVKESTFDTAGFYHVYGFSKYRFIDAMPSGSLETGALYIGDPSWVPEGAHVIQKITLLNGNDVLVLFDAK